MAETGSARDNATTAPANALAFGVLAALVALLGSAVGCRWSDSPRTTPVDAARARGSAPEREWRSYLGDRATTQSSPLTQIDRTSVGRLEVAWRYDAGDAGPGTQMQFNPLVVKGVLYGTSPSLRLFALDATTGEELWSFQPCADVKPWTASRGAIYWEDGDDERILLGAGSHVYAVDARSGRAIEAFGDAGRIDLRKGLGRDVSDDMMGVVATTPGVLFEDLLIVGGRVNEAQGAAPGHVRAFDVRSGEQRWIFHTIPHPGEPGYETWPPDAWERVGGANAWAGMSVDEARGLVFAPTGSATFDFHGGDRAGDNLYANTLLALDARTGERRWHYQTVRHDVWDRDLPSPPNLIELERDGARIPAVAQVTKTGDVFVFHRESGEPLFPIREVEVFGNAVEGEFPPASQPVPARPPAFVPHTFTLDSVTDRNSVAANGVRKRIEKLKYGPLYQLPSLEGTIQYPGIDGGAEWGGAAWDADAGLLYVNANVVPYIIQMVAMGDDVDPMSPAGGYLQLCAGCHGLDLRGDGVSVPSIIDVDERMGVLDVYRIVRDGRGRMPAAPGGLPWYGIAAIAWWVHGADPEDTPAAWTDAPGPKHFVNAGYQKLVDIDRLPGSKPPWGTLNAIDLQAGEIRWQVPLGDYPQILAEGKQGLGAENYGGPVVTAGGLVFIAATPDARIRAFDKTSGHELWSAELPAAGFATPAVYEAGGRQFVVVAAGGGKLGVDSGSEYVAYALPRP